MTMQCVDGPEFQCSGNTILRTENGIALSDSGVQAYGESTSDLDPENTNMTNATGFRLASGGEAEVRIRKNNDGSTSSLNLLLRNLGLSWDGINDRPLIIETFNPTQGRVQLDASGRLSFLPLPDSSDLTFYDYASLARAATQSHYANNRYFPREGNPPRCPDDPALDPCPTTETDGVSNESGNWRIGGILPDWASAGRRHADGDIHAGDGPPDENGNRTYLEGGSGIGIPFPGSKGYRSLANWAFEYGNLTSWTTQDTVQIAEWATSGSEHNKNRRGIVAFGDVTAPAEVPASGTATYSGIAYGWYTPTASTEPEVYWGNAQVTANFATREVVVTIQNTATYVSENSTPVPASFTATSTMGAIGTNDTNYMTGTVSAGAMAGGLSGRYFGPVSGEASTNAGPIEIGGTFRLSNSGNGQAILGGFIARKQETD